MVELPIEVQYNCKKCKRNFREGQECKKLGLACLCVCVLELPIYVCRIVQNVRGI